MVRFVSHRKSLALGGENPYYFRIPYRTIRRDG